MLNIAHIRGFSGPDDPSLLNPSYKTLHRIILETFGEPLWRYHDELELLEAFCAIVEGTVSPLPTQLYAKVTVAQQHTSSSARGASFTGTSVPATYFSGVGVL